MIPIIYESSETAFTSNGLGRLRDCIDCKCSEERNGIYEVDFSYPVDGANFDLIQCGRIIGVTHDETGDVEPFDIVSYSKPISGVVSFHAVHISYRQRGIVARGTNINSLADAFAVLTSSAQPSNPFTYEADFTSSAYASSFDGTPRSVRQFLGGIEGSILDAYGGEYEFDKFRVILHQSRGQLRDFVIRYGVNLLDYKDDTDYSETYTSCVPYWRGNDNGQDVTVVGSRVDLGGTAYNGQNICASLDLSDKFENKPTTAQLQSLALTLMQSRQTNLPAQNISVDFVRLQDMGYEGLDTLLQCNLCDSIKVEFPRYGMSGTYKIVKTVWDVLADKYDSMELGALSTSLAEALGITQIAGGAGASIGDDLYVRGDLTVGGSLTVGGYNMSHVEELTVTSQYADTVKVWKCGHVVTIRFVNFKAIPAQTFTVTTLPAGWRPYEAISFDMQQPRASGATVGIYIRCTIDTLGRINCYNYASATSGSTNVSGSISYVIGSAN